MTQEIEYIECKICKQPMPLLRKTKFGYNFCVNCSEVGAKRGLPVTRGEGDHTWTELEIIEYTKPAVEQCVDYNLYFEDEETVE